MISDQEQEHFLHSPAENNPELPFVRGHLFEYQITWNLQDDVTDLRAECYESAWKTTQGTYEVY